MAAASAPCDIHNFLTHSPGWWCTISYRMQKMVWDGERLFGYVKAYNPMLRMGEYELYKSVYCGLCTQMGRQYGYWTRLTLSYDFTFLALLQQALADSDPVVKTGRCCCNPLKRIHCCQPDAGLDFAGQVAMLMLWHKLEDDLADGGFWKRCLVRPVYWLAGRGYRKAAAAQPALAQVMAQAMAEQQQLEREGCTSTDQASHPTAQLLGSVLEQLSHDPGQRRVLQRLGYLLGRYVYLCDALDDLEQDAKSGSYNPLLLAESLTQAGDETLRQQAQGSLFMTIAEAGNTLELLEMQRLQPIIENIICLGLRKNVEIIALPKRDRPNGNNKEH